jgi:hypothetical protein
MHNKKGSTIQHVKCLAPHKCDKQRFRLDRKSGSKGLLDYEAVLAGGIGLLDYEAVLDGGIGLLKAALLLLL